MALASARACTPKAHEGVPACIINVARKGSQVYMGARSPTFKVLSSSTPSYQGSEVKVGQKCRRLLSRLVVGVRVFVTAE